MPSGISLATPSPHKEVMKVGASDNMLQKGRGVQTNIYNGDGVEGDGASGI